MFARLTIAAIAALCVYTPKADAQECTATLSWIAPMENTDGSPLENLAGYRAYAGLSSRNYSRSITIVDPNVMNYVVDQLGEGRWYFAVTAFNTEGFESAFSNEATKQTVGCVMLPDPRPPAGVVVAPGAPAAVYDFLPQENRQVRLQVGFIDPDTPCIADEILVAAGVVYHAVPRELVTWAGDVEPDIVYSRCIDE